MSNIIKGFKVFEPDWTCRGFQYKVGETFFYDGNIEMCRAVRAIPNFDAKLFKEITGIDSEVC